MQQQKRKSHTTKFTEYSKGMYNISYGDVHLGRMFEIGGSLHLVIDCVLHERVPSRVGGFSSKDYLLEYMISAVGDLTTL